MRMYNQDRSFIATLSVLSVIVAFMVATAAYAAQTMTTPPTVRNLSSANIVEYTTLLTMDTTGLNTTGIPYTGRLKAVITNPGTTAPSDNYDLEILNEDGADVMGTGLMNRDTANSEIAYPLSGSGGVVLQDGAILNGTRLTIKSSGNSVSGATVVVKLLVEKAAK